MTASGEHGVGVREVARPDDVVGADAVHGATPPTGPRDRCEIDALAGEVLRRRQRQPAVSVSCHPLAVIVEARQPVRSHPVPDSRNATRRLGWRSSAPSSRGSPSPPSAPAGASTAWRTENAVEAVAADRRPAHARGPRAPRARGRSLRQRVVEAGRRRGRAEAAAVEMVGSRHHAGESELGGVAGLGRGSAGSASGDDADAGKPATGRSTQYSAIQSLYAATRRPSSAASSSGRYGDEQADRRIEHDGVDALRRPSQRRYDGRMRTRSVGQLIDEVGSAACEGRRRPAGPSSCAAGTAAPRRRAARLDRRARRRRGRGSPSTGRRSACAARPVAPSSGITMPLM